MARDAEFFRVVDQAEFDRKCAEAKTELGMPRHTILDFSNCDLRNIFFSPNINLHRANLSHSLLSNTNLEGANLEGANLEGANLDRAFLQGANLHRAFLRNTYMENTILTNANLLGANLTGTLLLGANLQRANLKGAILQGAILGRANLEEANLEEANLQGANLEGANLDRAFLQGANLEGANLKDAYLQGAILFDANIRNVNLSKIQKEGCLLNYKSSHWSGINKTDNSLDSSKNDQLNIIQSEINRLNEEKSIWAKELEDKQWELNNLRMNLSSTEGKNDMMQEQIRDFEGTIEILKTQIVEKDSILKETKENFEKHKKEIEKRGQEIETALKNAFNSLEKVNLDLKPDFRRLNSLFFIFGGAIFILFIILGLIWYLAFNDFRGKSAELSYIWVYAAPSFIIVGFIWASVIQVNRAQRQLIGLKKYERKYKIVKLALEGYYAVENKLSKTPDKAKNTFDEIIKLELGTCIDIEKEELSLKELDKKDQLPVKAVLNEIINYIEKLK